VLEIGSPAGTTVGTSAAPADAEAASLAHALVGQKSAPEPEKTPT
jgi:hypothetical protein